ncbi:MAG TPA: tetratricopeptide repeat protein [Gaiellaceae bacterium]|nr:tetratricopeptide repeat protein [Gaiellaceae bacterium]
MTRPAFEVARLDDLDRFEDELVTVPIRIPLGIEAFGVNAYEAPEEGGRVIEEHDELGAGAGGHEELYVVLRGRARFDLAGEEVDAPAGTLVFVRDPAVRRGAVAAEAATAVLVVGGAPGRAFEPSPWEGWLEALPSYRAGEHAAAAEILRGALERHPGNSNVLYNLACCEALAGLHDDALSHLAHALEAEPRARDWAQTDSDLDPIRDDPRFPGRLAAG